MLSILPYHQKTTQYFKGQPALWQYFASKTHKTEQLREFKTDLLKSSYKFSPDTDVDLYNKIEFAKDKLNLQVPVTLYQTQNAEDVNASIVYIDNEAHIVFSGKIIQLLSDDELLAIVSHELSHVLLYTQLESQVEVADRIVTAIANNQGCTPAHYETARLFRLYTEIFCDRGAYVVTGSYAPIVSSLVKISTGLQTVNADSYIKQAEEIFAADNNTRTSGISHPENFIRARAIWLWHSRGHEAEPVIQQMIEGNTSLDEIDLFKQENIATITQDVLRLLLYPKWMQTPLMISLAKQYFGEITVNETPDKVNLSSMIGQLHSSMQDYLSYVLYDFSTADKELEDLPLGHTFYLADELKLNESFANAVKKEKKLTDKKASLLKKKALSEYFKFDPQIV